MAIFKNLTDAFKTIEAKDRSYQSEPENLYQALNKEEIDEIEALILRARNPLAAFSELSNKCKLGNRIALELTSNPHFLPRLIEEKNYKDIAALVGELKLQYDHNQTLLRTILGHDDIRNLIQLKLPNFLTAIAETKNNYEVLAMLKELDYEGIPTLRAGFGS